MNNLRLLMILASALCLGGTSCSIGNFDGSTNPTGITIDLTGTWAGTWTSATGESGPVSIEFLQQAPTQGGGSPVALLGSADLEGSTCFPPFDIDAAIFPGGFVDPTHLSGDFTDGSTTMRVFAVVNFESTGFSGTYEVLESGVCQGETGTIQASLVTPTLAVTSAKPGATHTQTLVVVHDDQDGGTSVVFIEDMDNQTRSRHALHSPSMASSVEK